MRVAVVGAGPAGLTAAHRLVGYGHEVDVYEAAPHVGGLARSIPLWGQRVDLGSHIFRAADAEVDALFRRLAGQVRMLDLQRGIWTGRAILGYPIRPLPAARALGVPTTLRSGAGLVAARATRTMRSTRAGPATSAEDVVVRRFGRPLYDALFREYAEKLWGIPGSEVDASFAHLLLGESETSRRGPDRFPYPVDGTGSVWLSMAAEIEAGGGAVHGESPVTRVLTDGDRVRGVGVAGVEHEADVVISTVPASVLARGLPDVPAAVRDAVTGLATRSTVLVYLLLAGPPATDLNWLYVYPPTLLAGRVTSFAAWGIGDPDAGWIVSVEYWCGVRDDLWGRGDAELVALAGRELATAGLCRTEDVRDGHVLRLPGTHPLLRRGVGERLATVEGFLDGWRGLVSLGRHGRHGLPGVGECMESAHRVVDRLHETSGGHSHAGPR